MDAQLKAEVAKAVRTELVALLSGRPRAEVGMQSDSYLDSFLSGIREYLLRGPAPANGQPAAPKDGKPGLQDLRRARAALYDKELHPGGRAGMWADPGKMSQRK